ncbi:MAG TPA: penicillin-binding protein 2 [Anaerohalosphaeraceae bacterium]|jgi:cell division protein FtsI/penicillin-binding protein 2|nr:penicillin-binding protein 2 [Anaerohalosphaeraceae bacterium]HRT51764.1 penicillin-binding protein 2 [Anaerohalosphaeraceae bacterium]HRT87739.1 penicillin-binding protein 2 [Anaerohalosphaeraceae bacterium]
MTTQRFIIAFHLLMVVVFGLLGWRLFYLQHCRADHYANEAYPALHAFTQEEPQRGRILDSGGVHGRVLAASNKIQTVYVDPGIMGHWDDVMQTAAALQEILGIDAMEFCDLVAQRRTHRFVKIKEGITEAEREAILAARLRPVGIQSEWRRYYPMGALTSHIVGFVGGSADIDEPDRVGLAGAEQQYEALLKGARGKYVFLVDKRRYPIGLDTQKSTPARDGSSIILTIDSTIQEFARSSLLKQIQAYQAESGVAIVMNPWNGAILALVSWPDFDPAAFSKTDADRLRNRAVADPFEPGSIFKPIVAAAALDRGLLQKTDRIFCENGYYEKYRIGEWAGHQFGYLTVKEILTESSNIGMAKIGQKMGQKALYDAVRLFGFGQPTGVDLPGEDAGILAPTRNWSSFTVTRIPYGHEISVTPMQIIRAFAILANGGSPVTPHIVRAVVDDAGNVTELSRKSNLAGRLIKQEVAEWIVREALTNVVKEGTGQEAALEKWQAWGKTGTANIATNGRYDTVNYTASFVGGAPADVPQVVTFVAIRKPNKALGKGYSGGRVAAPVFREIMEKTLTYLEKR